MPISDTITQQLNSLEDFAKNAPNYYLPIKLLARLALFIVMILSTYIAVFKWPFSALYKRVNKSTPHSGKPIEVNTEAALKKAIDSGGIVMVDFSAQWCGPCLLMEPAVDAVAQIYKGKIRVVKADVSLNTSLAQAYGVRGFPTIMMFNDAKELSRKSAAMTQRQLTTLVNDTIHAASIV